MVENVLKPQLFQNFDRNKLFQKLKGELSCKHHYDGLILFNVSYEKYKKENFGKIFMF